MRALVACERSGIVRDALIAEGVDAISCDLHPSDRPGPHYTGDVRNILGQRWDLLIAHPVCRYLTNSGVRWLHTDPTRWPKLFDGVEFFRLFDRVEHIPHRCVENPIMHKYARELAGRGADQYVQPWHHGDEAFKATGLWLTRLRPLADTNRLTPPKKGTPEHKLWSQVFRCPPGPERERIRSETYPGIARAMARQFVAQIRGDLIWRAAA